ncbi:PREDICTED: glutathione S-transferase zeta class-like isoform X2 [Lupinus angustifolius]|uniref:glutathione S-transferase zeta class-like isoform X2 n=1 Tax=Lupinus angustifolius TaxID=3871 RepID=UPI00092F804A|nr:PREDICTED: glutathione S-transferase zeta class-like isoform X2 [Lupinus angustifolius]
MAAESVEEENKLTLYSYWRSSCSFRLRIALNLKSISYDYKSVNLLKGEQSHPEFLKLNPVGFVPVLVDGPVVLTDSFAIIMYLEDKYPHRHPLLPNDILKRAINFQNYIAEKVGPDEKLPWAQTVIRKGFTALEKLLKDHTGRYATGDEVFLADVFLAPQLYSAFTRFKIHTDEFPILSRLYATYNDIPAFREALPENQPDAVH